MLSPCDDIGMEKMAYIDHRNEAQPSSCGQYIYIVLK